MKCNICGAEDTKYKCPNCRILYCSLDCWKEHKKTECKYVPEPVKKVATSKERIQVKYEYPTEDTVPLERLELLGESKKLQQILKDPHLRELLVAVDSSSDPGRTMDLAMQESVFVEFADECLKIVERPDYSSL